MRDLEQLLIGTEVNAKVLHKTLEIEEHYFEWIEAFIFNGNFRKGSDYAVMWKGRHLTKYKEAVVPDIDYIISVDMAKELCFHANTELGKIYNTISTVHMRGVIYLNDYDGDGLVDIITALTDERTSDVYILPSTMVRVD
jgi:phage anti-repressor protein